MKKIVCITFFICSISFYAQQEQVAIVNLEANSEVSDFGITIYGENEAVFASARRGPSIDKRIWSPNKQPYLELYKAKVGPDGELSEIRKFSDRINTKYHESNLVFTKDLKTVYFSRNNYINKKFRKDSKGRNLIQLYKAEIGAMGEWTNIQAMPFNSDEFQTGHPCLNSAEDKLYFISDMPGSIGMTDIYVVDINADGTYGTPENLGPTVNTVKREMFPFVNDDNLLYFSSDGYESNQGGLDIYSASLENLTDTDPVQLGAPFNSPEDDFSFVLSKEQEGYFSSNRSGGKGDDDIYYFSAFKAPSFKCEYLIRGVVLNKDTKAPISGVAVKVKKGLTTLSELLITNERGEFRLNSDCEDSHSLIAEKNAFKPSDTMVVSGSDEKKVVEVELLLEPSEFITKAEKVLVNIGPIYFDLDSDKIREDAARELDKVLKVMLKYPELKIDLGSHTDSRAPDNYNMRLSERRAKSTMVWLIDKGISNSRLTGKGYGETQLVNKCANGVKCKDTEHQKNRRTEFVIVNPEVIK